MMSTGAVVACPPSREVYPIAYLASQTLLFAGIIVHSTLSTFIPQGLGSVDFLASGGVQVAAVEPERRGGAPR